MRVLIGALLLLLCAWRTHDRARDWRSDEAIWTAAAGSSPDRVRPALNVAMALVRLGRWDEAAQWTAHAIHRMSPRDAWTHAALCSHLNRLEVLHPDPPSLSVECAF